MQTGSRVHKQKHGLTRIVPSHGNLSIVHGSEKIVDQSGRHGT
ncbi:MAG: hypothetical protein WAN78_00015 [Methanoregula sp.]